MYAGNNTVGHLFEVVEEWNRTKEPTDEEAERFVTRVNSLFGHLVHRNSYAVRWRAWRDTGHKDRVYCRDMRCLKTRQKTKIQ